METGGSALLPRNCPPLHGVEMAAQARDAPGRVLTALAPLRVCCARLRASPGLGTGASLLPLIADPSLDGVVSGWLPEGFHVASRRAPGEAGILSPYTLKIA